MHPDLSRLVGLSLPLRQDISKINNLRKLVDFDPHTSPQTDVLFVGFCFAACWSAAVGDWRHRQTVLIPPD